ncbi:2OG-Fe dioxygenase-domain-containing protein [Penicillium fimorum]|uniref:2OG-Fe dioxygenase-domain-containing protein n=1 Tax=Penicillium fimorum TaxID=1882269 RepID=A0A9W9XV58_9EURO|nr:2OG-Fe dioxygenase-domain-containing protein [Penicillium fimorum]
MAIQSISADLILLREQFIKNRLIFVEGARIIPTLKVLGATDNDLEKMKTVSDTLRDDPTPPFRKSKNGLLYVLYNVQIWTI